MMKIPPETCCGCSACSAVCPVNAIAMTENSKGFYSPVIDAEKCIGCGLCAQTCPELNDESLSNKPLCALSLIIKSDADRIQSTSGGAFTVLSDGIFALSGIVFGTVYDDTFKAMIVQGDNAVIRNKMRGSKYVESDVGQSYCECAEALKKKTPVLFTGTPCQIGGLVSFLRKRNVNMEQLYTCQIVCHGTPSPMIFRDHLNHIQTRRKQKIEYYYHRPKNFGWHEHNEMVCYVGGKKESQSKISQNHKDLFYSGYSLRECCFQCRYAGKPGYADFTIGDFWGAEFVIPELDDNKGISILLINSEKGMDFFRSVCKDSALVKEIQIDDALKYNHTKPSRKPKDYDVFWDDYKELCFQQIVEKYAKDKMPDNFVYYCKKWMRRALVKLKLIGY